MSEKSKLMALGEALEDFDIALYALRANDYDCVIADRLSDRININGSLYDHFDEVLTELSYEIANRVSELED